MNGILCKRKYFSQFTFNPEFWVKNDFYIGEEREKKTLGRLVTNQMFD